MGCKHSKALTANFHYNVNVTVTYLTNSGPFCERYQGNVWIKFYQDGVDFLKTHNHINALGVTVSLMLLGYVNHITLNVTVVHLVNKTQKFFSTNFILIRQY